MNLKKAVCFSVSTVLLACGGEPSVGGESVTTREVTEGSTLLTLLNHAPAEALADSKEAGLLPDEVDRVLEQRRGADGIEGTEDDSLFENLDQVRALDSGAAIEQKVATWAQSEGYLEPGTVLEVQRSPMVVNCAETTGEALQEAIKQRICPAPGSLGTARGTKVSNCGYSHLWIIRKSDFAQGNAFFDINLTSSKGPMARVSYNIPWRNETRDNAGNVSDTRWPFRTVWETKREVQTGVGRICGTFTGSVVTVKGYACDIAHPTACSHIQ